MKEQLSEQHSFYSLLIDKGYDIEIPIIQRDYAQGRSTALEVRNNFLEALYGYLKEGKPFRDLDFVYGDVEADKIFIPLDGQQRLTTLFLLHWFLACKEGVYDQLKVALLEDGYSRFTYKTRPSSSEFCDAILKNPVKLETLLPADKQKHNGLSKTIKDSPWYYLSWNYDPTIQSMLCMLDAIHSHFGGPETNGFYAKLIDKDNPVITFQFLPLSEYGLTDDLYIKMNSRGKPLSKFENFKAKFEQNLNKYSSIKKYSGGIQEYFSHKIDTIWADLFWPFRDTTENVYDGQMMNFIGAVAINNRALKTSEVKQWIDKKGKLPFEFFIDQDERFVTTLIDTFDLLGKEGRYNKTLPDFPYYNEIAAFSDIINNSFSDAGYAERIKFFAYYSFLVKWSGNSTGLDAWMRIIVNLTEHTGPFNSEDEFVGAIKAVNRLLPKSNSILNDIMGRKNITGFNSAQVKEERIKAYLIYKSETWANTIYEAEKHPYFKGQLTFALAFSGIEDYFDTNQNCDWSQDENTKRINHFQRYINLVFSLFDSNGLVPEADENFRLHRAVLIKGDYTLHAKKNWSFLINKHRDISWKRLLLGDDFRKENREYFRQVIDDQRFNPEDLRCLKEFVDNIPEDIPEWRKKFIIQPKLLKYLGSFNFIRFNDEDEIFLLKGERINGEHVELYSYSLLLKLEKEKFQCSPFESIEYLSSNVESTQPYIYFFNWEYKGHSHNLDISYCGQSKFKLSFYEENWDELNDELKKLFQTSDFEKVENQFEKTLKEIRVESTLSQLCKKLSELP